jgi:hypothetical protein
MNVITHSHAYSLFPLSSFELYQSAVTYKPGGRDPATFQKYIDRGWTMVTHLQGLEWDATVRRVGDRACWTISLQNSPKKTCTLTLNSWKRLGSQSHQFSLIGDTFSHADLRYSYSLATKHVKKLIKYWLVLLKGYVPTMPFIVAFWLILYLGRQASIVSSSTSWTTKPI